MEGSCRLDDVNARAQKRGSGGSSVQEAGRPNGAGGRMRSTFLHFLRTTIDVHNLPENFPENFCQHDDRYFPKN